MEQEEDQSNKGHRKRQSGRKAEKKNAKKSKLQEEDPVTKRNPKAFAVKNVKKAQTQVMRKADWEEKKANVPKVDPLVGIVEVPPILIAIVGPPKTGKTTLLKSLVHHYTKQKLSDNNPGGPITVVSGKSRRITFVECQNDIFSMIDIAKTADLVLLLIDASFGFEMETFEFLNICQTHGFPKIMGILTHLDCLNQGRQVQKTKKKLKTRFWNEIVHGAKLFYLTGLIENKYKTLSRFCGEYKTNEVNNLARFLSIMKFKSLTWRMNHSYIYCDRIEDITNPELTEKSEKTDRDVYFYGYVRGSNLRKKCDFHLPGFGDFVSSEIEILNDPCPSPSATSKTTVRKLHSKHIKVYAPMVGLGQIIHDKDSIYIDTGGSHSFQQQNQQSETRQMLEEIKNSNQQISTRRKFPFQNDDGDDGESEDNSDENDQEDGEDDDEDIEDEDGVDSELEEDVDDSCDDNEDVSEESDDDSDDFVAPKEDFHKLNAKKLSRLIFQTVKQPAAYSNSSNFMSEKSGGLLMSSAEENDLLDLEDITGPCFLTLTTIDDESKNRIRLNFFSNTIVQKEEEEKCENHLEMLQKEVQRQEAINAAEFADDEFTESGVRPGKYVKVLLKSVPFEFIKHFNPKYSIILGSINAGHENNNQISMLNSKMKLHKWFLPKILKSKNPILISCGWRRFESCAVFSITDHNGRNRFLKYTPTHVHCNATFYGPIIPQSTSCLFFQLAQQNTKHFKIAANGVINQLDVSINIVKKLKLIGYPFKVYKKTAFIKGMFNSELEVSKFEGAKIKSVSGIRGLVKKSVKDNDGGPGCFRGTFEDKLLLSDIVFCRTWVKVIIPKLFLTITNYLQPDKSIWVDGMKNVSQLNAINNIAIEDNPDSHYKSKAELERKKSASLPLKIPKKVELGLPFSNKVKFGKTKDDKSDQKKVIIRSLADQNKLKMVERLRSVYNVKKHKRQMAVDYHTRQKNRTNKPRNSSHNSM